MATEKNLNIVSKFDLHVSSVFGLDLLESHDVVDQCRCDLTSGDVCLFLFRRAENDTTCPGLEPWTRAGP